MPQSNNDAYVKALRKLADACTKMADTVTSDNPTEAEIEQATGAFMIAIMEIGALK